ncbi:hypothetical protein [Paramicrobacterium chengjingii]|uniref:hypothetical protein n=1 Tax=Paramicrobacterium chengjingii TaxID=2769067 RepID=UPI0014233867|nr:hypothetical protein [Microbacterium chengjingii]
MTSTFKSSNGWHIDEDGRLSTKGGCVVIVPSETPDVAQFFTERRDHELGRWRDKGNPDCVVYDAGVSEGDRWCRVVNERTGTCEHHPETYAAGGITVYMGVARAYFLAHPQRKPLPTEPGLYIHRLWRESPEKGRVLRLNRNVWEDVDQSDDRLNALELAQKWQDAGELVRLAPVESEDGE